jgi:diguanylate cyclase (GGDEF)-like protein
MDVLEEHCRDLHCHFLLCYMDLDGFKDVNDTYGHDIGDRLIKAVAQRIQECLKEEDQLFRIGGDEFVAIVEAEKDNGWKQRMESIEKEFKRMFIFEKNIYIEISISIGCAIYPQTSVDGETLLREADSRMYGNKEKYAWK